ncbi:MAG TPA: DUF1772 domain-containing protein [Alloacidobacterium sp.]|jgi:uncharacterized membrane protein|nr:DUF1772 domain-containing protein [Alloacidobacterium sp.]
MHFLNVLTILCTGLMAGNELAVSLFVNPVIWQLEEQAQAKALRLFARSLGKAMPFWYIAGLILLGVEAYLHRHDPAATLLLVAVAIWAATIPYTLFTLLPINNRIAALTATALPAGWRQEHKKWDTLHRWRILMLALAVACFSYGILGLC